MLQYVLIAEDHPICAAAIKLAAQDHDSTIFVETCETLADALRMLGEREYDALVLDLGLKDSSGLINLSLVRSDFPGIPVLIISGTEGAKVAARAKGMGAQGFLNKEASLQKIGSAIGAILAGGDYFEERDLAASEEAEASGIEKLSKAQLRVMHALSTGSSNKVIAYELGISEPTVKSHLTAIYRALGVTNRSQAIMALKEMGGRSVQ
ncbi:response regulator transcription factor [Alteraurantiacibacter aquimixticola]|nr:response regulator transcription factor [Alteraurantiacibacter aquimixticola]